MSREISRQCVITRAILPRSALFRIVRTPGGAVMWDREKSLPGRGMYVRRDPHAVEELFSPRRKKLWKHFLKMDVPEAIKETMHTEIQKALFPPGEEEKN